jgi:hypothetical protein
MTRMTRQTWVRRLATLGAAAALPLTLTAGTGAASGLTPADPQRTDAGGVKTQLVTFKAPGCEGCRIRLHNAQWGEGDEVDIWQSKGKKVVDGRVTFAVPAGLTRGLSVVVGAPWEGTVNHVTAVAFKYGTTETGDVITVDEAQTRKRGSACWGGTDARRSTLRLVTAKVTVEGADGEPTAGTLAFAKVTQPAMVPMVRVYDGVLGSQDVNVCGKR